MIDETDMNLEKQHFWYKIKFHVIVSVYKSKSKAAQRGYSVY